MSTEPYSGGDSFHAEIAGCFKQNEGNEEDNESNIELIAGEAKILFQALNTGIADVDAIDKWEKPYQEERRQEAEVAFSSQSTGSLVIGLCCKLLHSRYRGLLIF